MDEIRDFFLPKLEGWSTIGSPSEQEQADIEKILRDLKAHIDWRYKRPEDMYCKVKKMIAEWGIDDMNKRARRVLRQTREQYMLSHFKAKKKVEERNGAQTLIPYTHILEVVENLKLDTSVQAEVTLLMLASGCRKIEILDPTIEFETAWNTLKNDVDPTFIVQNGCAKKRACKNQAKVRITKPLLFMSPAEFLSHVQSVREYLADREKGTRATLGKTIATSMEKLAHKLWPMSVEQGHRTGSHINRAIYVNCAYTAFGRGDESLNHFVSRVLGHDELSTATHYMNVRIVDSVEDVNKPK